jgi:hypothetical protein
MSTTEIAQLTSQSVQPEKPRKKFIVGTIVIFFLDVLLLLIFLWGYAYFSNIPSNWFVFVRKISVAVFLIMSVPVVPIIHLYYQSLLSSRVLSWYHFFVLLAIIWITYFAANLPPPEITDRTNGLAGPLIIFHFIGSFAIIIHGFVCVLLDLVIISFTVAVYYQTKEYEKERRQWMNNNRLME